MSGFFVLALLDNVLSACVSAVCLSVSMSVYLRLLWPLQRQAGNVARIFDFL